MRRQRCSGIRDELLQVGDHRRNETRPRCNTSRTNQWTRCRSPAHRVRAPWTSIVLRVHNHFQFRAGGQNRPGTGHRTRRCKPAGSTEAAEAQTVGTPAAKQPAATRRETESGCGPGDDAGPGGANSMRQGNGIASIDLYEKCYSAGAFHSGGDRRPGAARHGFPLHRCRRIACSGTPTRWSVVTKRRSNSIAWCWADKRGAQHG